MQRKIMFYSKCNSDMFNFNLAVLGILSETITYLEILENRKQVSREIYQRSKL